MYVDLYRMCDLKTFLHKAFLVDLLYRLNEPVLKVHVFQFQLFVRMLHPILHLLE